MNVFRVFRDSNATSSIETQVAPYTWSATDEEIALERLYGYTNYGNTCYANSVLQALYFCPPFRELVQGGKVGPEPLPIKQQQPVPSEDSIVQRRSTTGSTKSGGGSKNPFSPHRRRESTTLTTDAPDVPPLPSSLTQSVPMTSSLSNKTGVAVNGTKDVIELNAPADDKTTLFSTLRDLFCAISSSPNKTGVVGPQAFIRQLKQENELFRSTMHQDAHEFLYYLLNAVAEHLEKQDKSDTTQSSNAPSVRTTGSVSTANSQAVEEARRRQYLTWIHRLFEGTLTSETRCLTCETVTSRDESFIDLSIDIEENTSITSCLRQFSASEMLGSKNKFSCDTCCGLQEAEKRMKIKHLPDVLALHLKRFKWQEDLQAFTKLSHRVVFPLELRLFNTVEVSPDADRLYKLWAIVVHIGAGPHHGHYITIIKSLGRWIMFDDDLVTQIEESDITKYYGDNPGAGSGYVLFYQAADLSPTKDASTSDSPSAMDSAADGPLDTRGRTTSQTASTRTTSEEAPARPNLSQIKTGGLQSNPVAFGNSQQGQRISPESEKDAAPPVRDNRRSFFGLGKRTKSVVEDTLLLTSTPDVPYRPPSAEPRDEVVDTSDTASTTSSHPSILQPQSMTASIASPMEFPMTPVAAAPAERLTFGRFFGKKAKQAVVEEEGPAKREKEKSSMLKRMTSSK